MSSPRVRYPRVACCVPFCRRGCTRWPPPYEYLCGDHYRLADKALRTRRTLVRRRLRNLGEIRPSPNGFDEMSIGAARLDNLFWRKIKRQAITRAAGAPL